MGSGFVVVVATLSPWLVGPVSLGGDAKGQDRVVMALEKAGWEVQLGKEFDGSLVCALRFQREKPDDDDLVHLREARKLPHSLYLILARSKISDQGLSHVSRLTNLKKLSLFDTRIGDQGVARLKKLSHLQRLSLGGTDISDQSLEYIKELKALLHLDLSSTKVSDKGLSHLRAYETGIHRFAANICD